MKLEPDPDQPDTIVGHSETADSSFAFRVVLYAAIFVLLPVWIGLAVNTGALAAFLAVLGSMLILFGVFTSPIPSRRPIILSPRGVTLRLLGGSIFIDWDAIHRIEIGPHPGWFSWPSLAFHLRPGVQAGADVRRVGWGGQYTIRNNTAYLANVSDPAAQELLRLATKLHRQRLRETGRMEAPSALVLPYQT